MNEKPLAGGCKAEFTSIVSLSVVRRVLKQCSLAVYMGIKLSIRLTFSPIQCLIQGPPWLGLEKNFQKGFSEGWKKLS